MYTIRMERIHILKQFVREGIRFECVPGCIKCCAIPGMVFVKKAEIPKMAKHFGMEEELFIEKYLARHWADVYNLNFPDTEPCMFLTEKGCAIYEARPDQCRTFPFWPENMSNASSWKTAKKLCPGIGTGRNYLIEEIREIMEDVCFGPFL